MIAIFQSLAKSRTALRMLHSAASHSIIRLFDYSIISLLAFSPSAARATEIEFKPGVVIEVDGDVEDSFLENGDLLLQWKSGTGSLTLPGYAKAWVLEVGGGGGAGGGGSGATYGAGAGGGAGGFVQRENLMLTAGTYNIAVGEGGAVGGSKLPGVSGGNSSISNALTEAAIIPVAIGGGFGGYRCKGGTGGSGGGSSKNKASDLCSVGGECIAGQGNAGGGGGVNKSAGGGGGAGGVGGYGNYSNEAGPGGDGLPSLITGTEVWYAGGGGGGLHDETDELRIFGKGGKGGGGDGADGKVIEPKAGEPNTGGGGGGGNNYFNGREGGSGVVIIRITWANAGDIEKPVDGTSFVYDGSEKECIPAIDDFYTIVGTACAVNVGSYKFTATLKPGMHWGNDPTDTAPVTCNWSITKKKIAPPTKMATSFVYTGEEQTGWSESEEYKFSESGTAVNRATNAGTYTPTVELRDPNNTEWASPVGSLSWTIQKASLAPPEERNFTYDGDNHIAAEPVDGYAFQPGSVTCATNAGDYSFTVKLDDNHQWNAATPPTPNPYTVNWKIARRPVTPPELKTPTIVYDGKDHVVVTNSPAWTFNDGCRTNATAVGKYSYTLILTPNYCWVGGGVQEIVYNWEITPQPVDEPAHEEHFCYDATGHSPVETNALYDLTGELCETNVGDYIVTARLKDPANYVWSTGGTTPRSYGWDVTQRVNHIVGLKISGWQVNQTPSTPKCTVDGFCAPGEPTYAWATNRHAAASEWTSWWVARPNLAGEYWLRATIKADPEHGNWSAATAYTSFSLFNHPSECLKDYMDITLSGYTGSTVLKDYPVLVRLSETTDGVPNGFSYDRAGENGASLCFTYTWPDQPGRLDDILPYEIDKWNPNGESLVWVRIPELKPAPNSTVIRLYWAQREGMAVPGNDPETVWTNFVAVYHFSATNTYPTVLTDSTANHLDAYPTKRSGASISDGKIGKKVSMNSSTQLMAPNPDYGKTSSDIKIIRYDDNLTRTEASGSTYSLSNTIAGTSAKLDEVRLIRTSTPGYNDWKTAEVATLTDPNYAVRGHVSREGVQQDYWTEYPSITPASWDEGDAAAATYFKKGAFASGAAVSITYKILPYGTLTNELPTAMGEYVAIFDRTPEAGWSLVGGPREVAFKILGHAPYPVVDNDYSASGRILLANNDYKVSGAPRQPEVNGQGWFDNPDDYRNYKNLPTYWTFPSVLEAGGFNLHKATEAILWRNAADNKLLWHLKDCRQGNLFPKDNTSDLASNQNYLPWSSTSLSVITHNATAVKRSEVGWIVMRNVADAAVTSGCFTNGVGTIYFDIVNCRTDSTPAMMKVVVEYLTQDDVDFDLNDDEMCKSIAGDAYTYARYPATWKKASMVPMLTTAGGDFVDQTATTEFAPAITTGGASNNFYRVRVTLNERKPIRFRIRRLATDPNRDPDSSGVFPTAYIILDNILVSKPPQSAELVSYGSFDETKTGKEVVGAACALSEAFPSMTDRGLLGRAKLRWFDPPRAEDVVSSAVMHYRWRYLNQAGTKTTDWKTVYLDPENDFWSVEPLQYSQLEGDIEYYFTADLKASFFTYSDYSGSGHAKPVGDFTEELREIECRYRDYATSEQRLPSNGTDWFVRLRNGKSNWESVVVEVTEGDLIGRYPMELVADGQWRALVMLKDEYEGPCKFRFRGVNLQQPRADYTTGVDQVWSPEKTTLPLPGSGKLTTSGDGATVTIDHAAGYLEFKMSDIFNTFTVARAEKQDFNYWNDAVTTGDKFHVNYTDTNSVDIAHMKSYALADDMSGWSLFSATNGLWNETFYLADYHDPGYERDVVFITHDTPNKWNAQNISFVGEKLVKDRDEESLSGGLAGKLLGEGKGKLDFTKTGSNTPDGLDTITFRARIGQSATFDGIGYSASGIVDDDYTFFVPLTMSQACAEDGNTLDDMAVGASVSLICCYFPYEGCYEFRVSRPYKGTKRTLALYKWKNVNGVITSTLLCSREFSNIAWTDDRNAAENAKRFYGAFVSCEWSAGGTKLICGISNEPQTLDVDDKTPATHFSNKAFEGLVYTDKQSPYDSGAYGVMSKDCPARFMMPIKFENPMALASDFALKEDKDDKTYQYFDGTKVQATEQNPLTIPGAGDTTAFEDCRTELQEDLERIAAGRRAINWALPKMRLEGVNHTKEVSQKGWWTGIRTPTNLTQQAIVMVREKGNTSEIGWEEVYRKAVKSYSLDLNMITIPLRRFGEWDLRFTTGEDAVDVVFDDIIQSRWHAPDDSHIDSSTVIFTYTQGKVERTASKAKAVTLQPARANEDYPVSVRSPILDGLGRVSFQYEKADREAQVWLQIATNQVARNLYDSYTPSVKSVDFGGPQTVGTWMTLKKFGPKSAGCDEELGTSGRKSVYLGWHDNEDRPVTGVFRLFVPTNVVRTANAEAHKASGARTDLGQITVTSMSVCDEPGLSARAWRGWNLRTFGDESDSERRMYIADSTLAGFPDATGLSCGLNNQTNLSSLTSKVYREGLDEVALSGYPAIYSPTFGQVDGKQTGVGAVSFKARLYARQNETSKPGLVVVYGARNSTGDDWTLISSNAVVSSVFTNFTWSANGEVYSAIKFELTSPGYTKGVVDTGRIILDEIVISEKIQPSVGFVYARPFRQNLATKTPIDDILSPNEQPLAGESWGIQAKVAVEQLEDEVDLSKGFKVYFSYFTGKKPWGYEQWKNLPGAVLDEELEQVGEPSNLVYRSTFNRVKTLVEPAAAGNTVVQYMLTVKYRDKSGEAKEYVQPLTPSKWENPSWYWPVDYNRENGGYADTTKFSAYTILDTVSPGRAWINEVSWNDGTKSEAGDSPSTTNQFVEVCVPSGVDMKGWWVQVTGYSQDAATQCRKTGKLFTFGHLDAPSSKATGKAVNGYEFFVMQSPATSRRADGGIKGIDGKNAADGTWSDASQANLTGGSFSYYQPYQLELFRPSGVLEHQFVLQGTNTSTRASSWVQYEGTNLVAILNREDLVRYGSQSPRRFYAGQETSRKQDGTLYASAGVVGGTKEGDPAPGAEGTWKTGLKFTAGSLNEGQVIPLGWFLPPNGTNSWVYVSVEGEHLYQTVGTNRAASILLVVPQSSKTNVVYTADNFYELDSITVNGVTNAAPETRHNPCKPSFTYVIDHPTGTMYVVAHAGLDKRVLDRLDPKHPDYAPSVVRWLASNWPGKDAADIVPAHFQCVSSDSAPKYPLSLTDMYWLDIPPFTDSGDPEWLFRAGVTGFSVLSPKWMRGAWYTNLLVTVKMYKQHGVEKLPVTHLQGLNDSRSNQPGTYGAWVSETFKIRGALDLSAKFLPFRTFILNDDSFNPEYESLIEIIDPFSTASPGYSYGWDLHPDKRGSCFWRISIDTDTQPFTTEMLKAEDTY